MTDSYQPDLETVAHRTSLEIIEHRLRTAAAEARNKADAAGPYDDEARYWAGYADAMDRCSQALKGIIEQW